MKKWFTVLLVALALIACKSDDSITKDEQTPVVKTGEETEEPAKTPDESEHKTFGTLVNGATTVTVSQRTPEDGADFGGSDRVITDSGWIQKFVAAVGADLDGTSAVPRCVSNYTIVFSNADQELASFGAVCGEGSVTLVSNGAGFAAQDSDTAHALLKELAKLSVEPTN